MADTRPFAGLAQDSKIDELILQIMLLVDALSFLSPDAVGRLRVNVETGALTSLPTTTVTGTLTGVTTVTTCSTVTNQAQMGGYAANQHMIALTLMTEADLRRNIVIS